MQVIDAGHPGLPNPVENDPDNQGDVIFQRVDNAGSNAQETPLLEIYDSSWVSISHLSLEGVQTSESAAAPVAAPLRPGLCRSIIGSRRTYSCLPAG